MSRRRVAVTGIGMVSPTGTTAPECWEACLAGRAAVAPIPDEWLRWSAFQSTVWAPLPTVDFAAAGITPLEAMRLDGAAMLAVVAAREALADAKLEASLGHAAPGAPFQFERIGYFCADQHDHAPTHPVFNRTVTLRDTWAKVQGRRD